MMQRNGYGFLRRSELRCGAVGRRDSRYMRLVERSARNNVVIHFLLERHGGLLRRSVAVRRVHSPWPNAKTSPAESPAAARCGSSPNV